MILHPNSTVALIGCSNGVSIKSSVPAQLGHTFSTLPLKTKIYSSLYCATDGKTADPQLRAAHLMDAFRTPEIKAIFDITGGDAANAMLPYLDFSEIAQHPKPFFGYSDLSVLLNPLQDLAHIPVYYFQARFLMDSKTIYSLFQKWIFQEDPSLLQWNYTFLQGTHLDGTICGGNIRCTLKLAGTPWQPNFTDRILFLESYSGNLSRIETMLYQYRHIGAFRQCKGILLGNFSELAASGQLPNLYALVLTVADNPKLPIIYTTQLGHQPNAKILSYQITHHFSI